MSGLEVVGVVVGILPLAIEATKGYRAILSGVTNVDRDLNALIRDLETEHVRLRTTCELLFDGVAPLSKVDTLIEAPFGPAWKPYNEKLRLRLWSESGQFENQVAEMQKAAQELKAKLAIEEDGKTRLTDRLAILKELRRRTSFTLKKKDYDVVINRIKTANSVLHELAGKSCGLEPNRRRRSQARLTKLVRALTRSVFNALRSATTCRCANSHRVCLELVSRNVVMVPSDIDDQVAKDLSFHVVMGPRSPSSDEGAAGTAESVAKLPNSAQRHWKSLLVQPAERGNPHPPTSSSTIPVVSTTQGLSRTAKWPRSLSFRPAREASSISATRTLVEVSKSFIIPPTQPSTYDLSTVSNLCRDVFRGHKEPAVDCYGYITDIERKFKLYPTHKESQFCMAVTLRQVLAGREVDLHQFNYPEKLRVALALSASILHLYNTPWMGRIITLDDIVFLREEGTLLTQGDSLCRPFIVKILQESDGSISDSPGGRALNMPRPMNLTMLSLGALLIQIIMGKADCELDITAIMDMNSILSKNKAGNRLGDQVLQNGGINYADAVKWCLRSLFGTAGLDNDDFCQSFYVEVVARLEEDVAQLND